MTVEQGKSPSIEYIEPTVHPELVLEGLDPERIANLGHHIIQLAESPGETGAFVARGNHLVDQGYSTEEIHEAIEAAMREYAESLPGGYVGSNAAVLIDNGNRATTPWPHVDGSAYDEDRITYPAIATVQGNTTHQGKTVVTTAIERPKNTTPGAGTMPRFAEALRKETSGRIPISGVGEEIDPGSIARSILEPGDAIFFRTGGRDMQNKPVPGTAHNFDIAPGDDMRLTQPVSVRGTVNPHLPVKIVHDQGDVL